MGVHYFIRSMKCKRNYFFLSSFFLPCIVIAQFGSIRFNHIKSEDGLAHEFVHTITRDKTGYMWFGTRSGLNRYDGYEMKLFQNNPLDSLSLSTNEVYSSLCTKDGSLWFGTRNGLSLYNPVAGNFTNILFSGSSELGLVKCLSEDKDHNVWIGTPKGLFVIQESQNVIVPISTLSPDIAGLDTCNIEDLFFDENRIYIATLGNGLWLLDAESLVPEVWTMDSPGWRKLHSDNVRQVIVDQSGNLWTGYMNGIIERRVFSDSSLIINDYLQQIMRGDIKNGLSEIVVDLDGRVWVSSSLSGLSVFDDRTMSFVGLNDKAYITAFDNARSARSIYVDVDGTMWLAMHTTGILYFNLSKQIFTNYERPDGVDEGEIDEVLLSNWTRVFQEDPEGRLWIGTTDGVSILDRTTQTFSSIRNKSESDDVLTNNSIRSMLNVNDEFMLIGTAGGLTKYDFKSHKSTNYFPDQSNPSALPGGFVLDLRPADGNQVFVATNHGIALYNSDNGTFYSWTDHPELHGVLAKSTRLTIGDEQGAVWIGKADGGLLKLDPNSKEITDYLTYKPAFGHADNVILDMLNEGDSLWIGTKGGLLLFDKSKGKFSKVDFPGMASPGMVGNFWRENENAIWFTGSTGLIRYQFSDSTFSKYDVHHGLPSNSFHFQHAYQTKDNYLCIASLKGFSMFRPESLRSLIASPKATITELRVLNEVIDIPISDTDGIHLNHDQNYFTVTLNAFDYLQKDFIQYAYMLEGLNEVWVFNGKNRHITFTNVPGGDYVLKFKTTTADGVWPEEFQSLKIHIATVFYNTWWFKILIFALISAILFLIMKYRQNQKQKVELLRQKIASDLHDDIGSTLSSIRMYSEVARTRKSDAEPLLEKISENARNMVDSMSDIVWAIKPGNDRFEDLKERMQNFANEICGPSDIVLSFHFDDTLNDQRVEMERRRDIYLVFKEAVNNAVKYSSCKNLKVSIVKESNLLVLEVEDDGVGFNPETIQRGDGLSNMNTRIVNGGGQFNMVSAIGGGTRISCKLPFTHFG